MTKEEAMNPLQIIGIGYGITVLGYFLGLSVPEKWEVRIFSFRLNTGIFLFWILLIVGCLTAITGAFTFIYQTPRFIRILLADDALPILLTLLGVLATWYGLILSTRSIMDISKLNRFTLKLLIGLAGLAIIVIAVTAITLGFMATFL